mgnify:CR=1 FL=1
MSRVGKNPIAVPAGVDVAIGGDEISVKGPQGALVQRLNSRIAVEREGAELVEGERHCT